jgi:hypothetical protein
VSEKVVALIVKQKFSPPGKDPYWAAELTLLDGTGREFLGSPRRLPAFEAVAELLKRETEISYEELQNAKRIYEANKPARVMLKLEDEQISNMGFRQPESERPARP